MPRSATQTRERILDGAYMLFRRRGYSRVTMDDIAAEARLTKRTLYHHFESKDQLLSQVLTARTAPADTVDVTAVQIAKEVSLRVRQLRERIVPSAHRKH